MPRLAVSSSLFFFFLILQALIGCCINAARGNDAPRSPDELTAAQTVSEALQAEQVFERVFRKKLERADGCFLYESLWPGWNVMHADCVDRD